MSQSNGSLVGAIVHDLRLSWRELALTDVLYKLITFTLLTPVVTILFQGFLWMSGRAVLADEDILRFVATPLGLTSLIVIGAVVIAILALEYTALMVIVAGARRQRRVTVVQSLRFTATRALPVLLLTGRIVAWSLLLLAPFLAAAAGVYFTLLDRYDINYYLAVQPPEFWTALGLGGLIAGTLTVVALQAATTWMFALPLLVLEKISPKEALGASRQRTRGYRWRILLWICGWGLSSILLAGLLSGATEWIGRAVINRADGSLTLLLFSAGSVLTLWGAANLSLLLASNAAFAALLSNLAASAGIGRDFDLSRLDHISTRKRLLTVQMALPAALIGALLASAVGIVVFSRVQVEDYTEITAHRGASEAAPENTMAAVRGAIEEGADWVEIDVQETADGEVVLMHDSDFKKIAGNAVKIWEVTAEELGDLDIGSWFGPEFANERVPTLDRVLDECKGRIRVNIELKHYGRGQAFEERVIDLVERKGMVDQIVIMSLQHSSVDKVRTLRPGWKVGLLTAVAFGNLRRTDADFLAVPFRVATRSFIRSAHRAGKEVHVWTVNDTVTMSTMMSRGVDNLITDRPALARSVLDQRAEMNSVERLLVELARLFKASPEDHFRIEDF